MAGPHAVGAKGQLPGALAPLARWLAGQAGHLLVPVPVLVPALPLQLVHEEDVGQALLLCVLAAGPPGAYNIAADGILTAADIAREAAFSPRWRRCGTRCGRDRSQVPAGRPGWATRAREGRRPIRGTAGLRFRLSSREARSADVPMPAYMSH